MNWLEDERFLSKIEIVGECWIWHGGTAGKAPHLYGRFSYRQNGKAIHTLAHKTAYESKHGKVPDGLVLDHVVCQIKLCCHPDHTEPVTQQENVLRYQRRITHCPKGHEYTEANTKVKPTRWGGKSRTCRACACAYQRRKRDQRKLECV